MVIMKNKTCNASVEFKSKKIIEATQLKFLQQTLRYVARNSPFYRDYFRRFDIKHTDIKSLKDISKLPITTKEQLQRHNKKFYCVSRKDIAEIVSTTGTTGKPVFIVLTKQDLDRLMLNEARSFLCANADKLDTFHIAVTLDNLFMAGAAYYLGIMRLGASVYRAGMHNVARQIALIKRLKPTGIVTVPYFFLKLIDGLKASKIKPSSLSIKKALIIGDTIRNRDFSLNGIGALMKSKWPIKLYSTYGNSEAALSFCECEIHHGSHEHSEFVISEILDENGNPVASGELGELVLTALQSQGMPLLRYKTGDMTFQIDETCKCGRNSKRIGPILGRKSHMLKFKGTKLYPSVIENAIMDIEGVCNYVIEAFTGDDFSDKINVKIGSRYKNSNLKAVVCEQIKAYARVTPSVEIIPVEKVDLLRMDKNRSRKPRTFIDYRKVD